MLLKNFKPQSGSHILEIALIIPFLFFLVIGASDINTALQSYTALEQGVKKSLRCAYPTDGDCVKPDPGTREPLYQVTKFKPTFNYYIPSYDYSGEASWGTVQSFREAATATVVSSVDIYYKEQPSPLYKLGGRVSYYVQEYKLPYVSQTSSGSPGFRAIFSKGKNSTANDYAFKDIPTNGIRGFKSQGHLIGETSEITLTPPYGSNECFVSPQIDQPLNDPKYPNYNKRCDNEFADIMIDIKGTTLRRPGVTAGGKVLLKLDYIADNSEDRDLGGRVIDSKVGSNNDFAVRGLIAEDCKTIIVNGEEREQCKFPNADNDIVNAYPVESSKHANLKVRYGKAFKLVFKFEDISGNDLGWEADRIRLFTSSYQKHEDEAECTNWLDKTDPTSCNSNHPSGLQIMLTNKTVAQLPRSLDQMPKIDMLNQACAENFGTTNLAADCYELCVKDKLPANTVFVSATCHESDKNLGSFVLQQDCQNPSVDKNAPYYPAEWKRYKNLHLFDSQSTIKLPGNPKDYKNQDKYACEAYPVVHKVIYDDGGSEDSAVHPKLPDSSIFVGPHSDIGSDWEKDLLTAAKEDYLGEAKLKDDIYFEAKRNFLGEIKVDYQPDSGEFRKEIADKSEVDYKKVFKYKAIPAECKGGSAVCTISFMGYTPGEAASVGIKLADALAIGQDQIVHGFPRADFSNASNAFHTEIKQFDTGSAELVGFEARMKVPFVLTNLFGIEPVEMSYKDSHKLEKIYSK